MAQFDSIRFQPSRPLLKEVSADRLNAILAEIKKNRPRGERGITVRPTGDGIFIGLAANTGGSVTQQAQGHPFKIEANSPDEGEYEITVAPGTINSVLPSNTFGNNGELRVFSIAEDELSYVVLTATTDGEQVISAEISVTDQQPEPQEPVVFGLPTEAQFMLGVVYNLSVYQVAFSNFVVAGKQMYIKNVPGGAQPGQLAYEIYYVLG